MPDCDDIYPWFGEAEEAWTCQPPQNQPGNYRYRIGCSPGCLPEIQDLPWLVDSIGAGNGGRFLRPDNVLESRNARGQYEWLKSGMPARMPASTRHQVAMCWQDDEGGQPVEFWERSICQCKFFCPSTPGGCWWFRFSPKQTCHWYTGLNYPPQVECTGKYLGDVPRTVSLVGGELGQVAVFSTGRWTYQSIDTMGGMSSDVGVLCWGQPAPESGGCNPSGPYEPGPLDHFHEYHNVFDDIYLWQIAASFVVDEASPQPDQAARARIKNMALAWLADDSAQGADSLTSLDRISHSGSNASLTRWQREWRAHAWGETVVLAVWPNCRLRHSRLPVRVEVRVVAAEIRASVVAYRQRMTTPCQGISGTLARHMALYNAHPMIQLRVRLELALWAELDGDGPHQLVRSWLPEDDPGRVVDLEVNNWLTFRYPTVTEPEEIVYVDDAGRQFDGMPPIDVEWAGEMHPLTVHTSPDVYDHEYRLALPGSSDQIAKWHCCGLAKGMSDMRVAARESHPEVTVDPEAEPLGYTGRHQVVEGFVRMGFRYNLDGMCPP